MPTTKALLVLCEGPHDVAFVNQIFKFCFGANEERLKFSEYPSPFNQLFRTSVEKHAAKDLSLDMAHKFFLPDKTLRKDDWLILLFNAGGKTQVDKLTSFLKDFLTLYKEASVFPQEAISTISEAKYLFLYDVDHNTPDTVAVWMQKQFATIEEREWILNEWNIAGNNRGVIQDDKALYVWADKEGKGTLEAILFPLYEISSPELLKKSQQFIEDNFLWDAKGKNLKQKFKKEADKKKAILCTAGQGEKPGRPLSAIINDNVLGKQEDIVNAMPVRDFVEFLHEFTQIPKANIINMI